MGAKQSAEMKKALRLLRDNPDMTQVEAAKRAGLKSSASISKHLKKTTGTSRKYEKAV